MVTQRQGSVEVRIRWPALLGLLIAVSLLSHLSVGWALARIHAGEMDQWIAMSEQWIREAREMNPSIRWPDLKPSEPR